jgi:hypothetical protein
MNILLLERAAVASCAAPGQVMNVAAQDENNLGSCCQHDKQMKADDMWVD